METQHYSHYQGPGCTGPFGERCLGVKDGVQPTSGSAEPSTSVGRKIFGRLDAVRRRIPAELKKLL